ncbi:MAG TPA: hypothetical protein PLI07_09530 [Candidatus Hydrogenedentes bacterium]|nr:hypothetical protein [Candidatus Hydrogenedentota bacterium]
MIVMEWWTGRGSEAPGMTCPLAGMPVEAGFPSPADERVVALSVENV